jgi:hypothetical protein
MLKHRALVGVGTLSIEQVLKACGKVSLALGFEQVKESVLCPN